MQHNSFSKLKSFLVFFKNGHLQKCTQCNVKTRVYAKPFCGSADAGPLLVSPRGY